MQAGFNVGAAIGGLGILASIAEAVPFLGAPVKGTLETLQKILEYSEVRPSQKTLLKLHS
jgi:hypothetical protein